MFALVLPGLTGCAPGDTSKLGRVKARGELVVATRNSATTYYEAAEGFRGIEYDMAKAFADHLHVELKMVVPGRFQDILTLVADGKVDMGAAGLTVTKAREEKVRFTPPYQTIRQQVVYRLGSKKPDGPADLVGTDIMVTVGTSYVDRLNELKLKYPRLVWRESEEKDSEELLQMVAEGTLAYTIVDSNILDINRPLYPDLRAAFDIQKPESLAWAFPRDEDDSLFQEAVRFQQRLKKSGEIKVLLDRYYGATEGTSYFNISLYQLRIRDRLPLYRRLFEQAGERHGIDWRLLAAISYQESQWNPLATSYTGVQGMMMLTQTTAEHLGVADRLDPEQSIDGGARYIRELIDRIPEQIAEPDRTWMALASYNVGYHHLADARILAGRQGGSPDKWTDVKEVLPLLSRKAYYSELEYGYARGHEPVDFVSRVRRYYDVLVKLEQKEQLQRRNDAIGLKAPAI
jgi:membrane-bound lytic murein transglycosylase F